MSRLSWWLKQARNLVPAEITRGWILISPTKPFGIGWKSEAVQIRGCKKNVAERLVRGGMCWSHQGNITRLMQFSIIWKQGDYSAFVSLKLPASPGSAPITVGPNGSLSGMMNRSWAYTLVPNFHFPCICLKSFLILTRTAASEPSVALVLAVVLVITALTRSL